MFENKGINVIRVGLHDDKELESRYVGGCYHPAFRQLCENKIYFDKIILKLKSLPVGEYIIKIPQGQYSNVSGQKNVNLISFLEKGYSIKLIESDLLTHRDITITTRKEV